ncbi:MAG: STAS domain-containing protein [Acidobacteriia bacterium]|nr:STAS domain-containing protein [Terriglobia bacterium]
MFTRAVSFLDTVLVAVTPSRSEDLKIELLDSPQGARVIKLTGPLVLSNLFEFQDASRREADKSVIVDISGVPYMDSAGLGAVISIFASCQRTNRGFAITGVSPRIKTLFQVTHCDGLLPCFETIAAADTAISQ